MRPAILTRYDYWFAAVLDVGVQRHLEMCQLDIVDFNKLSNASK